MGVKKLFLLYTLLPLCAASVNDALGLLTREHGLWDCVAHLDSACVEKHALRPLREFFSAKEIHIGRSFTLEKVDFSPVALFNDGKVGWDRMMELGTDYLKTHAVKFQFGQLEARLLGVESEPGNFEFSLARKASSGKSQKLYRVIIPLVVGFKITGMILFGMVAVKLFLIKATLIANTALLVAGGIVLKKLYDHGMGILSHHHSYLNSHTPLPNFYANNHDLSGYGYHGFEENNLHESGSEQHKTEWGAADFGDLHGQFSNHAIAMAALNKTLLSHQGQQPLIQQPKRRWSQGKPWLVNSNWTHL